MKTETNYQLNASKFARENGIKLTVLDHEYDYYFDDDKTPRDIYKLKLSRAGKSYTFKFGQSIADAGRKPSMYDVLACLTKYDPESFENFCSAYGYDTDSRRAEKTYRAVVKEYEAVERLFGDILEELREIQ